MTVVASCLVIVGGQWALIMRMLAFAMAKMIARAYVVRLGPRKELTILISCWQFGNGVDTCGILYGIG